MTKQEIFNTIQPWIAEKLGVDPSEVTMEAHLENDLGADSLDKAEMPFDLEEMFGVDINAYFDKLFNEYPDNYISTVSDMVTLVETLQNGNDSSTITQTKNAGATNPQTGIFQGSLKNGVVETPIAVLWLAVSNQKRTNSTGKNKKIQRTR